MRPFLRQSALKAAHQSLTRCHSSARCANEGGGPATLKRPAVIEMVDATGRHRYDHQAAQVFFVSVAEAAFPDDPWRYHLIK
jgi:hypothetical protein